MVFAGEVGSVPTEERWAENPDCVREAGEGDAAFVFISNHSVGMCSTLCLLGRVAVSMARTKSFPSALLDNATFEVFSINYEALPLPLDSMALLVLLRPCL